jgi:purine nucleoside permease
MISTSEVGVNSQRSIRSMAPYPIEKNQPAFCELSGLNYMKPGVYCAGADDLGLQTALGKQRALPAVMILLSR